ncbi:MAG TPA: hypothetical protein VHF23_00285 [Gaiellaceae bacterium]|nr:hypothetical protein [Gaiellaceae bacterium]
MRRDHRRHGGRRAAALAGVLIGFGLLAAIAFAFAGGNDGPGAADEEPTTEAAATETTPAKPVLRIVFPRASRGRRWPSASGR